MKRLFEGGLPRAAATTLPGALRARKERVKAKESKVKKACIGAQIAMRWRAWGLSKCRKADGYYKKKEREPSTMSAGRQEELQERALGFEK